MTFLELARRQRGWSQKELGAHPRVRIFQTFISQFERGTGIPTADQRERLSRVLGIPADRLLSRIPEDAERDLAKGAAPEAIING